MFERNLAFVIGINNYINGISPLQTAVNDAKKLVQILRSKHDYQVWICLDQIATLNNLNKLLEKILPEQVRENDRLLFYFAGHGVALNGSDGPAGYLIPQDAKQGDINSYLAMTKLHDALSQLPCRHFLGILDCCFAGAFRWSSSRDLLTLPEVIHKERYDRFITDPAWQIITSSASDQKALDNFELDTERGKIGNHSPFATALFEALEGAADIYPPSKPGKAAGDGVITATELYLYLRNRVEIPTEKYRLRQTPGIWCLKKHDKGEYIFLSPGHQLNLPPAPPLDESRNPYRGLQVFEEEHSQLFFGRKTLTKQLYQQVYKQPLTIVLGASGTGKSSLVRAGLIPYIKNLNPGNLDNSNGNSPPDQWHILAPMRPGESPLKALNNILAADKLLVHAEENIKDISLKIDSWLEENPQSKLLLIVDQTEELLTMCRNEEERDNFLFLLADLVTNYWEEIRIVLTLRSDFEPQFQDTILNQYWHEARFIIPEMTREELRSCIEEPASARVMYFEPHSLVDELIDEVAQMPGRLPLLSFTLSELYLKYLDAVREGTRKDRVITQIDYEQLGGVARSLTQRADSEYEALVRLDERYKLTIRHVMLRMIALSSGELARRRVPLLELEYPEPENSRVKEMIRLFTDARLLVEGRNTEGYPYVEPAHDALIRGWKKLLEWEEDQEENIILQRRLSPAAMEWKGKQEAKFLWNSHPQLNLLKQLLDSDDNSFNLVESEFVRRSILKKRYNRIKIVGGVSFSIIFITFASIIALIFRVNGLVETAGKNIEDAKGNLNANQQLDAFTNSLLAGKALNDPLLLSLKAYYPQLQENLRELRKELTGTLQETIFQAKERNRQEGPEGKIRTALSPDGKVLVSVGGDSSIRLWNLQGKLLKKWEAGQGGLQRVSFSPNGNIFATAGEKDNIRLWNLRGQLLRTLPGHQGVVNAISFNPDGKLLASGGKGDTVYLWDWQDKGKLSLKFKTNQTEIKSVEFSPNSKELVTGGKNGTIRLWDLQGKQKAQGIGHLGPVSRVKYSPDGKILLSGGEDTTIRLWNLQGKKLQECPPSHTGKIWSVSFSPDGQKFASVADDATTHVWNLQCQVLEKFIGHGGPVRSANFTPNSERLVSSGDDGTFRVWEFKDQELMNLKGHQGKILGVVFSPNGQKLVTAGDDGAIRWNLQNQQWIGWRLGKNPTKSVTFSPDSQRVVRGGKDGSIYLSDSDGEPIAKLEGHETSIVSVDLSPDDKLASVGEDDTIYLWDLHERRLSAYASFHVTPSERFFLKKWKANQNQVNSVSFSPFSTAIPGKFSQILASSGEDGTIKLWNLQGEALLTLENHVGAVNSISFSPDGKLLASGGNDATIRLWNFQGQQLKTFKVPGQNSQEQTAVIAVAFSPDGKTIFSRSRNDNVQMWNLEGELLGEWETNQKIDKNSLNNLSISRDSKLLATVGGDGSVKLWQIETLDRLMTRACKWVSNYLQNNSGVSKSDRHLCDGITSENVADENLPDKQIPDNNIRVKNITEKNIPIPVKSPIFTDPSPSTFPVSATKFIPSLQVISEEDYIRKNNQAHAKSVENSTQRINNPNINKSDKINAYINRGVIHFRQGKYHKAIADHTKVIEDGDHKTKTSNIPTDSQLINAYVNRGIAHSSLSKPEHQLAIEDHNKAIDINPNYADAYINRGIAYSGLGKHQKAIQDYIKAIAIAPQNPDIYYAKAFTQSLMQGKTQEGIQNYQKAADLYQKQGKQSYSKNALEKIKELKALFDK